MQAEREVTVNKACQEKWQSQDRKYEDLLYNACESRSDAKQSFESGPFSAHSAKHIIICTAQDGNGKIKENEGKPMENVAKTGLEKLRTRLVGVGPGGTRGAVLSSASRAFRICIGFRKSANLL